MSKAEKFIQDYTRNCSNEILRNGNESFTNIPRKGEYHPWLTPDQARRAVKIAREETYNKIWHWLAEHINDYVIEGKGRDIDLMFDDIKQAMKDE
jgi:hypothetical protein